MKRPPLVAKFSFAETFTKALQAGLIAEAELRSRGLARISCRRPLALVDLAASGGLAKIRADARLLAGLHAVARRLRRLRGREKFAPSGGIGLVG